VLLRIGCPIFADSRRRHTAYFQNQHMFIPIVHKARYLKAFHSVPHLRPPMGLQYAIWAMSSQVYRKYSGFHDAFYRRARQYLENDEMKVRVDV
jgi:hypothetical protein